MCYIDILQEMLRYIDDKIKEKLSVEKLAARAGFSPFHFCRIFQWETGYSIMEYVRLRRLAFAASELSSTKKIIDIAVDYGYETHTGFTKAFKRHFGCTPEKCRLYATFDVPKLPVLEKTKQYVNGGIIMEPKMIKKSAIKLAGFAVRSKANAEESNKAYSKLWQEYYTLEGRRDKLIGEPFVKSHADYGASILQDPEYGEVEHVVGVEVKEGHDIPKDYHVCIIPEALYAVFSPPPAYNKDVSSSIYGTYRYIFSEWFPNSEYEIMENGIDFVLSDGFFLPYDEPRKFFDVYIPVVKRVRETSNLKEVLNK